MTFPSKLDKEQSLRLMQRVGGSIRCHFLPQQAANQKSSFKNVEGLTELAIAPGHAAKE